MSRPTQVSARFRLRFRYGPFTLYGAPFQALPVASASAPRGPYYPCAASTAQVWAKPLSLATTQGIDISFFSCWYLDVSVPRVRPRSTRASRPFGPGGFPIRTPPDLFALADPRRFSQLSASFIAS